MTDDDRKQLEFVLMLLAFNPDTLLVLLRTVECDAAGVCELIKAELRERIAAALALKK